MLGKFRVGEEVVLQGVVDSLPAARPARILSLRGSSPRFEASILVAGEQRDVHVDLVESGIGDLALADVRPVAGDWPWTKMYSLALVQAMRDDVTWGEPLARETARSPSVPIRSGLPFRPTHGIRAINGDDWHVMAAGNPSSPGLLFTERDWQEGRQPSWWLDDSDQLLMRGDDGEYAAPPFPVTLRWMPRVDQRPDKYIDTTPSGTFPQLTAGQERELREVVNVSLMEGGRRHVSDADEAEVIRLALEVWNATSKQVTEATLSSRLVAALRTGPVVAAQSDRDARTLAGFIAEVLLASPPPRLPAGSSAATVFDVLTTIVGQDAIVAVTQRFVGPHPRALTLFALSGGHNPSDEHDVALSRARALIERGATVMVEAALSFWQAAGTVFVVCGDLHINTEVALADGDVVRLPWSPEAFQFRASLPGAAPLKPSELGTRLPAISEAGRLAVEAWLREASRGFGDAMRGDVFGQSASSAALKTAYQVGWDAGREAKAAKKTSKTATPAKKASAQKKVAAKAAAKASAKKASKASKAAAKASAKKAAKAPTAKKVAAKASAKKAAKASTAKKVAAKASAKKASAKKASKASKAAAKASAKKAAKASTARRAS